MTDLQTRGWQVFPADDRSFDWARAAHAAACAAVAAPENAHWLRCEGTWFAGVDVLPNAPDGSVGQVALAGPAIDALEVRGVRPPVWHRAQVSVVHPGYPRPREGESDAAFRYRQRRDAAHVDGLHALGPDRRRMLREPHGFILGLSLTDASPDASPLVVWEGSHRLIGAALRAVLEPHPPEDWPEIDLTEAYQTARRTAFDTCLRVPLHARPGEAILLHRHMLHGISPWGQGASAPPEGRMVAYFRPEMAMENWANP